MARAGISQRPRGAISGDARSDRALRDQPDELLRPPDHRRRRRRDPARVGAQRHGARSARHRVHAALRRRRASARPPVGQDRAPPHPGGRRVRLEPADRGVGHRAHLLAIDRGPPRRGRRRGDVLAGVHVAAGRSSFRPRARARRGHLDARPADRPRPGQRRRRMDPAELGLAQRVLRRRRPWTRVCRGGAQDPRAAARDGRSARRRRPAPPGLPVPPRALDSDDVVGDRVGGAAQLQHVRARRVRGAVPRALSPHELPRRRLGRRRVYGFSGIVGLVGGGALADRLYRRRVDGRLLVGMASIVICAPLMFLG